MNRKRILLVALVLLIIILPLFYFLVYVPHEFGKQYVSVSFRPVFFKYYGSGDVEIEYDERLLRAAGVYVKINVTNNYPNSVFVKYNGFDVVLLIYNQSLPPHNDPSDVQQKLSRLGSFL